LQGAKECKEFAAKLEIWARIGLPNDCFRSGEEVLAHAILRIPLLTRFSTSIEALSPRHSSTGLSECPDSGGSDGTRTPCLLRDRQALLSATLDYDNICFIFKDLQSSQETRNPLIPRQLLVGTPFGGGVSMISS
jgi:hypothetical protein